MPKSKKITAKSINSAILKALGVKKKTLRPAKHGQQDAKVGGFKTSGKAAYHFEKYTWVRISTDHTKYQQEFVICFSLNSSDCYKDGGCGVIIRVEEKFGPVFGSGDVNVIVQVIKANMMGMVHLNSKKQARLLGLVFLLASKFAPKA